MAQMYPSHGPVDDTGAFGEQQLYTLLRDRLSDEYRVIHSTNWHSVDAYGRPQDGEADFVIIHPRHGALVLEVKGGRVRLDGRTKQWLQVGPGKKEKKLKRDPFKQAMKSMYVLVRTLERAPRTQPFAGDYRLGYGVWLPHSEWPRDGSGTLQGHEDLVLDAHDLANPEEGLQRLFQHFVGQTPPAPLSDEAVEAFVHLLTPTIDTGEVISSLAAEIDGEEPRIKRLTDAQYERLQAMWQFNHQMAVPGAAGTGKTVLAMEMAARLAQEGLRVLFLCANDQLADWLSYRAERDPRPDKPRFEIHSVKSLITALAKQGGLRVTEIARLQMASSVNQKTLSSILNQNISALKNRGQLLPYDAVLVDEAQDIEQALWTFIQKLLRHHDDSFFYVFYDEAQRLDINGKWIFRPAGARTYFPLTENCRNTKAIYELMAHFNSALLNVPFDGPEVREIQYEDPKKHGAPTGSNDVEDAALVKVLDELFDPKTGGMRPEEVLVITCRSEAKSCWFSSTEHTLGRHTLRRLRSGEKDGCVSLSTVRSAKGLEYKVVILAELDGLKDERKRDALLYVATSRAMYHLVVLGSKTDLIGSQPSLWADLVAATFSKSRT